MASILDKIEAGKAANENQQLAAAAANANWANTFPSDNTAAENSNLDDLVASAAERKQQMLEQSDLKAGLDYARMKEVQARSQHAADMAPLNVQVRQAQFQAEQALAKERASKELHSAAVSADESNFMAEHNAFKTANPLATPEEINAHAISIGSRFPHAKNSANEAGAILGDAYKQQNEARVIAAKDEALRAHNAQIEADAKRLGIPISGIGVGGGLSAARETVKPTEEERLANIEKEAAVRARGAASGKIEKPIDALKTLNDSVKERWGVSIGDMTSGASEMKQVAAQPDGKTWSNNGTPTHVEFKTGEGTTAKTHRIPISQFDEIQAQIAAIDAPKKPATTVPPTIPDDHAAWLLAHPEKAASFDSTYGAGAAAKILGR